MKHYHNVNVASPGTGRPKPEAVKVAVSKYISTTLQALSKHLQRTSTEFFKNIIEGPPEPVPSPSESTHPEPARATTPPGHAKPPFPLTKKGTVSTLKALVLYLFMSDKCSGIMCCYATLVQGQWPCCSMC